MDYAAAQKRVGATAVVTDEVNELIGVNSAAVLNDVKECRCILLFNCDGEIGVAAGIASAATMKPVKEFS